MVVQKNTVASAVKMELEHATTQHTLDDCPSLVGSTKMKCGNGISSNWLLVTPCTGNNTFWMNASDTTEGRVLGQVLPIWTK